MSSTWYDVKLATLQKMFAADNSIVNDESTSGYLAAMPYAANEALQMLSTVGKFIVKHITIVNNPTKNLLADSIAKPINQFDDERRYSVDGAKSYYFECSGIGEYSVYVGGDLVANESIDSPTVFTKFKNLVSNPDNKSVEIVFTTSYPMAVRNVAFYGANFADAESIPIFRDKIPYVMTDLVDDFYMIDPQGIYFEGDYSTYLQTSDFYQEADKTLVLDRDRVGSYTVYYKAYPPQFTADTEDSYVLPLDPEVVALMSLYMASQLYKDDDNGIATSYRNEFEVAFERLRNSTNRSTKEEFTSESGWI